MNGSVWGAKELTTAYTAVSQYIPNEALRLSILGKIEQELRLLALNNNHMERAQILMNAEQATATFWAVKQYRQYLALFEQRLQENAGELVSDLVEELRRMDGIEEAGGLRLTPGSFFREEVDDSGGAGR